LDVVSVEGEATSGPQLRKLWSWKQLQLGCLNAATYKNLKQNHQTQTHHTAHSCTGQNRENKMGIKCASWKYRRQHRL